MYQLKFDQKVCASCRQADCLLKCQYMTFSGHKEAHGEMMKIMKGRDSRVRHATRARNIVNTATTHFTSFQSNARKRAFLPRHGPSPTSG